MNCVASKETPTSVCSCLWFVYFSSFFFIVFLIAFFAHETGQSSKLVADSTFSFFFSFEKFALTKKNHLKKLHQNTKMKEEQISDGTQTVFADFGQHLKHSIIRREDEAIVKIACNQQPTNPLK